MPWTVIVNISYPPNSPVKMTLVKQESTDKATDYYTHHRKEERVCLTQLKLNLISLIMPEAVLIIVLHPSTSVKYGTSGKDFIFSCGIVVNIFIL